MHLIRRWNEQIFSSRRILIKFYYLKRINSGAVNIYFFNTFIKSLICKSIELILFERIYMWKYINNFSSIYIIQVLFLIMSHHISSLHMLKVICLSKFRASIRIFNSYLQQGLLKWVFLMIEYVAIFFSLYILLV